MDYHSASETKEKLNGKSYLNQFNDIHHHQHHHIGKAGLSNGQGQEESDDSRSRLSNIERAYSTVLRELGEDVDREGLLRTPLRAAKAMQFLTKGYHETTQGKSLNDYNLRYKL